MNFKEKSQCCIIGFVNCHWLRFNKSNAEVHNEKGKLQAAVTFYPHTFSFHAPCRKHTPCSVRWTAGTKAWSRNGAECLTYLWNCRGWGAQHPARLSPKALSNQNFRKKLVQISNSLRSCIVLFKQQRTLGRLNFHCYNACWGGLNDIN